MPRLLTRGFLAAASATACGSAYAEPASLTINLGERALVPNMAGQQVTIEVENTSGAPIPVLLLQFNIQIDDGKAISLVPDITFVDLLLDSIFAFDNGGVGGKQDTDHRWEVSVIEDGSAPLPSIPVGVSTVGTVTFDTTGFFVGEWDLSLTTPSGTTTYLDSLATPLAMTISPGSIHVIPEPSSSLLVVLAFVCFGFTRRRDTTA
ncbi:MAG: PEP-CTERM sorting domain-containing protein [Verrucomicrobiales bacterium]